MSFFYASPEELTVMAYTCMLEAIRSSTHLRVTTTLPQSLCAMLVTLLWKQVAPQGRSFEEGNRGTASALKRTPQTNNWTRSILKASRERKLVTFKGLGMRIILAFSVGTLEIKDSGTIPSQF